MANYKVVDADQLDADLTAVADAIRGKAGGTDAMTLKQMPQRIANISAEKDYSRYASTISFEDFNLFGGKEVSLNLANLKNLNNAFMQTVANTTVEHLTVNCSDAITGLYNAFNFVNAPDSTLKKLTLNFNTRLVTNMYVAFRFATALEVIDGVPLDFSSSSDNVEFSSLSALREIRLEPLTKKAGSLAFKQSSNLSSESIQSIIDCLADLTGGTAQTLTLHATVGAKLTDEQKAAVAAKNWTLAY